MTIEIQVLPEFSLKKIESQLKSGFIIQDIDWSKWVPTYDVISKNKMSNGNTHYFLRSNSEKTLFMNAMYWSFHNFMSHIGYEPESPFLYVRLNPFRRNSTSEVIYREKIYDRLIMYENHYKFDGVNRKFLFVSARFFSNEIDKDFGFYIRCCSRTVHLVTFPYAKLMDNQGNEIPAEDFVHTLFLNMKYPLYIYHYNLRKGTLGRMIHDYDDLINNKGRYKKWRF